MFQPECRKDSRLDLSLKEWVKGPPPPRFLEVRILKELALL